MSPEATNLFEILKTEPPHREVYVAGDRSGRWFITYGGGEVSYRTVKELVDGGHIRSVYNNCPDDSYHIGRTLDVQRTVEERKRHRRGKDALLIYVDDPPSRGVSMVASNGKLPMNFQPVRTLDDLDALDATEMTEGYLSTERGDPEPGENRGRAFWHGWRCRMMDYGEIEADANHRLLVKNWLARERVRKMEKS